MSEFKFACPVCGQHMQCDSSQSGSVMECPTCFQKITAPQAPSTAEQKFILTGKKQGDRPVPLMAQPNANPIAPAKSFPLGAIILVVAVVAAAAGVFALRGKIFHHASGPLAQTDGTNTPAAPKAVAINLPPASDTNWLLNLDDVKTPDAPAVGRIHGQSTTLDRAIFQGGNLTLRPSVKGSPDVSLTIGFAGAPPEAIAGKTINIATNAQQAARVTLHWKEGDQIMRGSFTNGYALRLELGALENNHIPGKIYFSAPDELKSYALGTFNVEIRKPKPPKPKK